MRSISMLGRQKCPMTSVTAATRGGKPALGSKAGECLVKEFLHEIWEKINLEAKFRGSLEKTTIQPRLILWPVKRPVTQLMRMGLYHWPALWPQKSLCPCSVSQSLKTGKVMQAYRALANSWLWNAPKNWVEMEAFISLRERVKLFVGQGRKKWIVFSGSHHIFLGCSDQPFSLTSSLCGCHGEQLCTSRI